VYHALQLFCHDVIEIDVVDEQIGAFKTLAVTMMILEIALSIILEGVMLVSRQQTGAIYRGFVAFIRRLLPSAARGCCWFICSARARARSDRVRTVTSSVIHTLDDPVLFADAVAIIDFVGPAT
jgi:hypothetical protein